MRLDRYTQRAQEAMLAAQEVAQSYNHSQIEPEHLLLALLQQPRAWCRRSCSSWARTRRPLQSQLEAELARRPKAYGSNVQPGLSGHAVAASLQDAQSEASDARRLRQHRAPAAGAGRATTAAARSASCWRGWASRATASWPR